MGFCGMGHQVTRRDAGLCRLSLGIICTALFLNGCFTANSARIEAEQQATRDEVRRSVEQMRAIIASTERSPSDIAGIQRIQETLGGLTRPIVIGELSRALHDGDDRFNSVAIDLLDGFDANNMVPVRIRARTMTIEWVNQSIFTSTVRAEQADAYIDLVREQCSDDTASMAQAWLDLLGSEPITARRRHSGEPVDVTRYAQGLAMLAMIRTTGSLDLDNVLARIGEGRVTAPPVLFSQWLIHLSGKRLKYNLSKWLGGPAAAQVAAVTAVNLLRLTPPKLVDEVAPESMDVARAWVEALPNDEHWLAPVMAELEKLAAAGRDMEAPRAPEVLDRLARARQLLDVPEGRDPVAWLDPLPTNARKRAFERLVGIDMLIRPPKPAAAPSTD